MHVLWLKFARGLMVNLILRPYSLALAVVTMVVLIANGVLRGPKMQLIKEPAPHKP